MYNTMTTLIHNTVLQLCLFYLKKLRLAHRENNTNSMNACMVQRVKKLMKSVEMMATQKNVLKIEF